MKDRVITVTPAGAAALREFADAIPQAVQNIVEDTEQLNRVYQSVSDTLGIHEGDFRSLLQMIDRAQNIAADAINTLPIMLRNTAERIDEYVSHRPADSVQSSFGTPYYLSSDNSASCAHTGSGLPFASTLEKPFVKERNKEDAIREGLAAIERRVGMKLLDLHDKGIFDEKTVNDRLQEFRDECTIEFYNDLFGKVQDNCARCLAELSIYFSEDNWAKMDTTERQDALNTLAIRAGNSFRLNVLGVRFYDAPANDRGMYREDGYLYLNSDVLSDPLNRMDALDTIFHEGRHAFQYAAAKDPTKYGVDRETARVWENNLRHYIRYEKNPMGYFSQPVEQDARDFAEGVINVLRDGGVS